MHVGIYARQSLDKKDSVSIEAQIELCKNRLNSDDTYEIFWDKGFSGGNTNRPEFQKLLNKIKKKEIHKVICYKLDRISRSVSDFSTLMNNFDNLNVQYMSATENIDNTSPMGRAMINIIMTFAQLERENDSVRAKDSIDYRIKKGMFTGGKTIFGYNNEKILLNNKQTAILTINESESEIVKMIYDKYLYDNMSIRKLAKWLNENGYTKRGKKFDYSKLPSILRNPTYCSADERIYNYFYCNSVSIHNDISEFTGKNAILPYKRNLDSAVKDSYNDALIIIGLHKPIIDSKTWIKVQDKLSKAVTYAPRTGQSKVTYLSGLLKCGKCKKPLSVHITTANRIKPYRYVKCDNVGIAICENKGCFNLEIIETVIEEQLNNYCNSDILEILSKKYTSSKQIDNKLIDKKDDLKTKIKLIENKIDKLFDKFLDDELSKESLVLKIKPMEVDKNNLLNELKLLESTLLNDENNLMNLELVNDYIKTFNITYDKLDFESKKSFIRGIIKNIYIYDKGNITIDFFIPTPLDNNLSFGADWVSYN